MGRIIEGLWDCPYCSTKGIRGGLRECPNCGRSRDDNTRFYMPNQISYVSKEKAKMISRKPDWICPYCDSLNSDECDICESCGAERTSENENYFSNKLKAFKEQVNKVLNGNENGEFKGVTTVFQNVSGNIKVKTRGIADFFKNNWKPFIIICVILSTIIGTVFLCLPKNEEITITDFKWERSIEIERYQTVNESDWSLPAGARLQYSQLEISHYQQVLDHYEQKSRQVQKERIIGYEEYVIGYEDLGNGYFEEKTEQRPVYEKYYETEFYEEPVYRQEPVYLTKYYYEIDKWLYDRTLKTNGLDKEPFWRDVVLRENERISNKVEKYYIIGKNKKGKEKSISLDYETWISLSINQTVKLKVSIFGEGEIIK